MPLTKEYSLSVKYVRKLIKNFAQDLKRKSPQLFEEIEAEVKIPELELFSKDQINSISQEMMAALKGIYFLIQEETIVYIGQSINVFSRIGAHLEDRKIKFNRYSIVPCEEKNLELLETFYIHKFDPIHNQQRDFRSNIFCCLRDARENAKSEKLAQ